MSGISASRRIFPLLALTRYSLPGSLIAPITIVVQPMALIAKLTAETLVRRMREDYNDFPYITRLKGQLLLHDSVATI